MTLRSRVELDPSVAFDDPRSSEALKMRVPATGSAYGAILQQGTLKRAIRSAFSMRIAMYVSSLAIIGGLERWVIELNGYFNELGATCRLYILEGKQPPLLVPEAIRHLARFFDGDPARLAAAVRDDQIDVLVVHHAYAGLEAVDDPTLIVEVLHNIYFWQRDARSIRSLRRRFARVVAISDAVFDYAVGYLGLHPRELALVEHGINRRGLIRPVKTYSRSDETSAVDAVFNKSQLARAGQDSQRRSRRPRQGDGRPSQTADRAT